MSLHWSMSQFAGGMDEVTPGSTAERIFACTVFLFAFLASAIIVSQLTSAMTRLEIIASTRSQQVSVLKLYMAQNKISKDLIQRVQRNALHAASERQRSIPESKVELLKLVSEPLMVDLHFEMNAPILAHHPFFKHYTTECPNIMRKVCHGAISMMTLSIGDVIFSAGEMPAQPKMYIVCTGRLQYGTAGDFTKVMEAMWVAEAVMWTRWTHKGTLTAANDCRMCAFDAKKFMEICNEFDVEHHFFDPRQYAVSFVDYLNSFPSRAVDDLTLFDVNKWLDFADVEEEKQDGTTSLKTRESTLSRSNNSTMSVGWSPSNTLSNIIRSRKPHRQSGPAVWRAPTFIAEASPHSEGNMSKVSTYQVGSHGEELMTLETIHSGVMRLNSMNSEASSLLALDTNPGRPAWEPELRFREETSVDAQAVIQFIPSAAVTVGPQERQEVVNMRPASALKLQEPPPEAIFIESHSRVRTPGPKPSPVLARGRTPEKSYAERTSEIYSLDDSSHNNGAFRDFREQASFPGPRYAADTPDSLEEFEV